MVTFTGGAYVCRLLGDLMRLHPSSVPGRSSDKWPQKSDLTLQKSHPGCNVAGGLEMVVSPGRRTGEESPAEAQVRGDGGLS